MKGSIYHHTLEDQMDRALSRSRRKETKTNVRALALDTVASALGDAPEGREAEMAVSLLFNACDAVARLHDAEKVQSLLGAMAVRFGKQVQNKRERDRARAERLFGGRR